MSQQPDLPPRYGFVMAPSPPGEFSPEERQVLLQVARAAIAARLEHREISLSAPTPHLAEPRGAFTTLHRDGELRGCVGYVVAVAPLYRTVAETARSAAFDDTRFRPVSLDEIPDLEIHINVLSPLTPASPEQVEVGRHGLLISREGRRGLLLPEVAVEHGWDRVTFLEHTCRKAGLPLDAWQHGATVEVFTTEGFGDHPTRA